MASIRKRVKKDGTTTWAVLWRDPDTGKQTSRSLASEADAKTLRDFLDANGQSFALAAQAAARLRSSAPPLKDVVERHITMSTNASEGTRKKYRRLAEQHIYPELGGYPVDAISTEDVARWFSALPVAAKTKKNIHALLSAAFKRSVAEGVISKNPAVGLRAPREEVEFQPVFLTEEQMKIIYSALPEQWRLFVELLENSGLRYGEASALRWQDLTFEGERCTISVTRAWRRGESGEVIGPPKTKKSNRRVALPLWLSKKLLEARGEARPSDLVFAKPNGSHIPNGHFHQRVWIPLMKKLEGELGVRPRIHDLRHTHASRLISKGVALPVIQARLGHESITTTVNTYGHLASDADARAAALLD